MGWGGGWGCLCECVCASQRTALGVVPQTCTTVSETESLTGPAWHSVCSTWWFLSLTPQYWDYMDRPVGFTFTGVLGINLRAACLHAPLTKRFSIRNWVGKFVNYFFYIGWNFHNIFPFWLVTIRNWGGIAVEKFKLDLGNSLKLKIPASVPGHTTVCACTCHLWYICWVRLVNVLVSAYDYLHEVLCFECECSLKEVCSGYLVTIWWCYFETWQKL